MTVRKMPRQLQSDQLTVRSPMSSGASGFANSGLDNDEEATEQKQPAADKRCDADIVDDERDKGDKAKHADGKTSQILRQPTDRR